MLKTAVIISIIVFLSSSGAASANSANIKNRVDVSANGSSSNVNVDIKNNVNTNSNASTTRETSTNIHISQEGEGTSSVQVNGEEWKLEGPGEINVNEGDTKEIKTTLTIVPTEEPPVSPTSTPSADLDQEEAASNVLGTSTEELGLFNSIRQIIEDFFNNLFN